MPDGCDSVIPHELVADMTEEEIQFDSIFLRAGANRRRAGEDLRQGATVVPAGKRLMPADIGLLASVGTDAVEVFRCLRVAYFSTGDELCSPGESLRTDCIYDSNRFTLQAMIQRLGHVAVDLGIIADDPLAIEQALRLGCEQADVIIMAGGMSEGDADYSRASIPMLGEVVFCEVAMRPGRPMAFGTITQGDDRNFLFGLPGNPVAAMVSFYLFVAPALEKMAGGQGSLPPLSSVVSAETIKKRPGRTEYRRGIVETDVQGRQAVRVTGSQGSGILRSMAEANCLIVLDHERGEVKPGESVSVLHFHGLV
jgi:molybdopterin molybdotransferase